MEKLTAWFDEERGRRSELASALGLTPGAITQWKSVPIERANEVARITGIPREDLRPDIFGASPPAADSIPDDAPELSDEAPE